MALALLVLPFLAPTAMAAGSFPEITQPAGVWREVGHAGAEGPIWSAYADANGSARLRTGDIVHGREAYVYLKPQANGRGAYFIRIQEGDFDCKVGTLRWRRQADFDFAADKVYVSGNPAQTTFSAPAAGSVEAATLDFLCSSGDIHGARTYLSLNAARYAMAVRAGAGDGAPAPPTPNAGWDTADPPVHGDWRVVDEQVTATQLIDVSSLSWQGRKVRGWIAAVSGYTSQGDGDIATTLSRVEVDCDTTRAFFMTFRQLNRAGDTIDSIVRSTHADPSRFGILAKTDGGAGMSAICHPQRLASARSFATPSAYADSHEVARLAH